MKKVVKEIEIINHAIVDRGLNIEIHHGGVSGMGKIFAVFYFDDQDKYWKESGRFYSIKSLKDWLSDVHGITLTDGGAK